MRVLHSVVACILVVLCLIASACDDDYVENASDEALHNYLVRYAEILQSGDLDELRRHLASSDDPDDAHTRMKVVGNRPFKYVGFTWENEFDDPEYDQYSVTIVFIDRNGKVTVEKDVLEWKGHIGVRDGWHWEMRKARYVYP